MNKTIQNTTTSKQTTTTILKTENTENVNDETEMSMNQTALVQKHARLDDINECADGPTEFCEKERLQWWTYMIMIVVVFLLLLLLNFIVKKINEARMEERCERLYRKSSTCTQVQTTLLKRDNDSKKKMDNTKSNASALTGISLIFSKSDNDRFRSKTSTSTALRISDCGEAFHNARTLIDSIYEDFAFSHIIHPNTNKLDVIQSDDNIKEENDINEIELACGDANPKTVAVDISTLNNKSSDTVLDIDENTKTSASLKIEAIPKRLFFLEKKTPLKQFKSSQTNTTVDENNVAKSKDICLRISTRDFMTNEDKTEKKEFENEDPEVKSILNTENEIILNGSNSRDSNAEIIE